MGFFDFLRGRKSAKQTNEADPTSKNDIGEPQVDMGTPLFHACLAGDIAKAKAILDAGADPNVRSFVDYPEDDLFNWDLPQEVGSLLYEGAAAHRVRPSFFHHMELGFTNLYFPALNGNAAIVHLLLEHGADPDAVSFNGLFPLYTAAETGDLPVVADLVEHGADVNKTTPKGCTAILNAAEEGNLAVIKYLLEHGADPSIRNAAGNAAADAALRCGQREAERLIRGFVGEVATGLSLGELLSDAGVNWPLELDMVDLCTSLDGQAADALSGSYGQGTADALWGCKGVRSAALKGRPVLPPLLENSTPGSAAADFLVSAVKSYCLVRGIIERRAQDVSSVLGNRADPSRRCRYQGTLHTPIVAAARSGSTAICKMLLDAGADANQAQSNSETALANASQLGDFDMVVLLLEHDADPNATTHAGTALALADNLAIAMMLLACGADPNVADSDGDLPIVGFIDQGQRAIVQALVDAGSDLGRQNKFGESAIDRARRCRDDVTRGIVVDGRRYEPEYEVSVPEAFARQLEDRIQRLFSLSYPFYLYQDNDGVLASGQLTEAQVGDFKRALKLSSEGLDAKRRGDLVAANECYMQAFSGGAVYRSANIWGWCQVLLVAKNFRDALLVLRYFHAVSASYNLIGQDTSEVQNGIASGLVADCFLTLDFDAARVLQECMRVFLLDRSAVEEKIASYAGRDPSLGIPFYESEHVGRQTFRLSDEDYGYFLRYFVLDDADDADEEDEGDEGPEAKRIRLEEQVRLGNVEAYSSLAWLIYEEDRSRAIELCQEAMEKGDDGDAALLLANLLRDTEPERAKQLYERLVSAGDCYWAAYDLAEMVKNDDPGLAEALFQKAIDAGNVRWGAWGLAEMIKGREPRRAKDLFQMSVDAGDTQFAAERLAALVANDDPARAAELYEMAIGAGSTWCYAKLARLIAGSDRARAIELCEKGIENGDNGDAPFFLAWLLSSEDPERAKGLYQLCVDNGNCYDAANNLAILIKDEDPQRAKGLFEKSLEAGNAHYAAMNLADMLAGDDLARATKLYEMAIGAGNVACYSKLARLLAASDKARAVELCEKGIEAGDTDDAPFFLAWLLEAEDSERSRELYQLCVDNDNCYGAANNLAILIKDEDPQRALELFKMASEAGRVDALNTAGVLVMKSSAVLAADYFNKGMAAGDLVFAPCNLAHMLAPVDAGRAEELYRLSLENETDEESTEALVGLSLLYEKNDPAQSKSWLEQAKGRGNFQSSIDFMADYYDAVDAAYAKKVRSLGGDPN